MLEYLEIENAGPADHLRLDLAPRLNLLTGDNGLGKSFLLDVAWWVLSGIWPSDIKPEILTGQPIKPRKRDSAKIQGRFLKHTHEWNFNTHLQEWKIENYRHYDKSLVVYCRPDGDFCIFDPFRNSDDTAFIFSNNEVWNGLIFQNTYICNGLIQDWSSWQRENGEAFSLLNNVLNVISPNKEEILKLGKLTRRLKDSRDIPTLQLPYGEIPVIHASAGIRRIISLVYMLVWAWREHKLAANLLEFSTTREVTFFIDELDAHLHPKWQRTIVKSLMEVMKVLAPEVNVQIIAATHSPLVMASVEPFFDPKQDAWFDLDLNRESGQVEVTKRTWYRRGDADAWLKSEAFDQKSGYALETEQAIADADAAMGNSETTHAQALAIDQRLIRLLGDVDTFWIRWRFYFEDRGWKR
nr:AAA family ATPase [Armatimonas sp.]